MLTLPLNASVPLLSTLSGAAIVESEPSTRGINCPLHHGERTGEIIGGVVQLQRAGAWEGGIESLVQVSVAGDLAVENHVSGGAVRNEIEGRARVGHDVIVELNRSSGEISSYTDRPGRIVRMVPVPSAFLALA